jgi:chaperone modulatory protein CbpM
MPTSIHALLSGCEGVMNKSHVAYLQCQVVEEDVEMSLDELCRASGADGELVLQLLEHGVLEARDAGQHTARQGRVFVGASLRRTRVALRLILDLELNPPGAALAVELLDEIARLRRELQANGTAQRRG